MGTILYVFSQSSPDPRARAASAYLEVEVHDYLLLVGKRYEQCVLTTDLSLASQLLRF